MDDIDVYWYTQVSLDIAAKFADVQPCPLQTVSATYAWTGLNSYITKNANISAQIDMYAVKREAPYTYAVTVTGTFKFTSNPGYYES